MKNFIAILLFLGGVVYSGSFFSCNKGGDTPDPVDTTKPPPPPVFVNQFKLNGTLYKLSLDSNISEGFFTIGGSRTTVYAVSVPGPGYAEFKLDFPGKSLGSFSLLNLDDIKVEVAIGGPFGDNKRKEYAVKPGGEVTIQVTQYDPVGGKIKGKFTGQLQTGINTGVVTSGEFDVRRTPDS